MPLAPFYPLYIRRSDGKREISTKTGKELNEPIPEQLDNKPNAQGISDFYRECMTGEQKEIDWRRKLGGMLMREIGGPETKDRQFILAALPDGYRVYEHVKCKLQDGSNPDGARASKSHAAGGNERQDAYLYGHPFGRKKRYRSPAEFFPHLLWLATDEEGDSNNCSCKFCSPEELETEDKDKVPVKVTAAAVKQESKATESKVTNANAATKVTAAAAAAASVPLKRTTSQTQQQQQQPVITQFPAPQAIRFRSHEQRIDAQYNEFIYRPGEIVWFSRVVAWGLAVITQRQAVQGSDRLQYQYRVQPLSHPFNHPKTVDVGQEGLRPWLAWSPPPCTCADLNPGPTNSNRVLTYKTINWQAVLEGTYGMGDAEVDGSIMAVKLVETTFTLFDRIDSKTSTSGNSQASEIYYNGIYLGAEKIWLGDPLRVRNGAQPSNILVLSSIIEKPNLQDTSRPQIVLVGDMYTLTPSKSDHEGASHAQSTENTLPIRVREDLKVQNQITSQRARSLTSFWKLTGPAMQMHLEDVKGRWYESSLFMPILDAENFAKNRANGEISDAGQWMNAQGDCNKTPGDHSSKPRPAELKAKRREDAFGKSIPSNTKISLGMDDPDLVAKQRSIAMAGGAGNNGIVGSEGGGVGEVKKLPSAHAPTPTGNFQQQQQQQKQQQQQQQQQQQRNDVAAFNQYITYDQSEGQGNNQTLIQGHHGQGQDSMMHNFRYQQ